ncbi:maltose ABC transporter substrate-binding protein [Microbacterium limosum]|uniref:Maltose ABC transporter substrate-binding protein n=1 Tax=Microbacterium limosum TaxID=3079935 RepID=A0AAU0MIR2_9MICO|nr:maltose ABC transporter substrate-binding protein [Microbacterium sp. Y20]WOQ70141.1 maltose ABC transporter substrate-binding protein [Microbacterium sp. Y20]
MRVNHRGALAFGAIVTGAALVLAGCSGGGGDAGEEETGGSDGALTVWVDADRARALESVAADFEEDRGIAVDLVVKEYEDIQQDFTTQVPAGEGPDITIGGHDWTGAFVQDGVVAPVELGDKAAEFEDVAVQAVTYNGNTYGLPYAIENIAMLRNADLVAEPATSFDDMIAKGQAAGTQYPFVVGLNPQNSDPYHLYPFQTSFGNSVFAQNADGSYDAANLTIGDEAGQQFAAWLGQQGAAGILNLNLDSDLAKEAFNAGQSPFYLTGPWNVADAQAAGVNVAVDPIPSAGGQTASPFAGVQVFFVSAQSENALAANEFLVNYIATPEVQTALFEAGGRAPALTESFEAAQSDPIVAGFATVGAEAVPMPSIPQMAAVWDDWGTTEVAIIQGADPASSWTTMAGNIEGKIG